MAKRAKVSAGDLFPVEIPSEALEARIVLDVGAQGIAPRRLPSGSPLAFSAESFLIEVWRGSERIIPGVMTFEGEWAISGHRDVNPEEVDFPQTLMLVGPRPHLTWGEVQLPLALSVPEMRQINVSPRILPLATLVPLCLSRLGLESEIDPALYQVPEAFDPGRSDLRFSRHAERIRSLLGERVSESYFATALRYGYDTRRFYQGGELTLVLCPYCNVPIDDATVNCPTCGLDVRNDALVETTNVELALERRKRCRVCEGPMLETAMICPGCKTRQ